MPRTTFDTDLEERLRRDTRQMFESRVGPPGPAIGFTATVPTAQVQPIRPPAETTPKESAQPKEKTEPVSNPLEQGGSIGELMRQYAGDYLTGIQAQPQVPFEESLLGKYVVLPYSRWRYNRMTELGFPHEAIGEPTPGLIPAPKAEEQQMAKMPVAPQFSGQQSQGGMNWATIQSAIQRYAGFQPGVTDIAKGYQLTQEQANRLLNQPLAQPAAQPIPAPTVGWYQIEGQPRQVITDEYWKTPVQGGGSFNVIPGSAAGPQWAPPVTLTVGGKEYTLPATAVIDLAKNLPKETPKPPEWTIPPQFESKIDELTKIIQAPPGTYTIDQRNLAAHALSDLNRQVLEFNKGQMDVWRAQMGYPLQEREVAARERGAEAQAMGATAQLMTAGPHAEYYRKLAKEGQLVPPGYAVFSPETQQKLFEHREKSEPIWRYIHDAMAFATEKTPTGEEFRNPASFVGYLNMIGKVFDIEELKNLKFKDLSQPFTAPYIHRLLQTSPKTQNLKPGSAEYNEAFAATLRELYK